MKARLASLHVPARTCARRMCCGVIFAALLIQVGWLPGAHAEPCSFVTTGLDTTHFTTKDYSPNRGNAEGQTFYAPESVITRITVWRPPNDFTLNGMHLWVTSIYAGYDPPIPNTHAILLDGPTLYIQNSDPPGQVIEVPFILDPPLVLPGRGTYAFFLQPPDCFLTGTPWHLCGDSTGNHAGAAYPDGQHWATYRPVDYGPCYLPGICCSGGDLIFKIDFCDAVTPTRRSSWGKLKLLYR